MSETDKGVLIHHKIEREQGVPQMDKIHIPLRPSKHTRQDVAQEIWE